MMKRLCLFLILFPFLLRAQDFTRIEDSLKDKYEYIGYNRKFGIAQARTKKQKATVLDSKGRELFPASFNYINITPDGFIEAGLIQGKSMKRGYINKDGSIRIPIIYDNVFISSKNAIQVTLNNKTGILDTLGNTLLPAKFDAVIVAGAGYYFARDEELYGLYHDTASITTFLYKDALPFTNGYAPVLLKDNTTTIIDTLGKPLFASIKGHKIIRLCDGYAIIQNNASNKFGLIDLKGLFTIPCKYTSIEPAGNNFIVTLGKYSGLSDFYDRTIIPFNYSNIITYDNSIFFLYKENTCAVVNDKNIPILPGHYKHAAIYSGKYIIAINDTDKTGIFDLKGNSILPFTFKFYSLIHNTAVCSDGVHCYIMHLREPEKSPLITLFPDADSFKEYGLFDYEQNGYHIFKKGNKYGLLYLLRGSITIPAVYDDIEPIFATYEYIIKLNSKYGIINAHNEIIEKPVYDEIILRKETIVLKQKGYKDKFKAVNFGELPED